MSIEVTAHLDREVFLAGESVNCQVTVRNQNPIQKESLAWCSVQLHCQQVLNGSRVNLPHIEKSSCHTGQRNTALTANREENGLSIYSSRPTVLFCDLQLLPGEIRTFECSELVPEDGTPPSYKGHCVKYIYKLTIGVQHVNSPVKLLRIPIRVMRIVDTSVFSLCRPNDGRHSPTNPFLTSDEKQSNATVLEIGNGLIENITSVRNCHIYSVTSGHGKVASFALFKSGFKLGDDIVGRFSFENCDIACVQYCVSLQSIEELTDEYKLRPDQKAITCTHVMQHAVSLFYGQSEVKLNIPLTSTPSFFTSVVHLRWRLHFEFVLSSSPLSVNFDPDPDPDCGLWTAPHELNIETMVWDLPLKVFPCSPLNACLCSVESDRCATLIV